MPSTSRERRGRARLEPGSPSSPLGSPRMAKLHAPVALAARDGNNRAAHVHIPVSALRKQFHGTSGDTGQVSVLAAEDL